MRKSTRRTFTHEEKARLVAEVIRLYRFGDRTYKDIAAELGIHETNYHNWVKQGIKPATKSVASRHYDAAERKRLVSEVDRLRAGRMSLLAACRQLDISDESYRNWCKANSSAPAMRRVEITALVPVPPAPLNPAVASSCESLTLLAPGGYHIQGLTIEAAAALLKALA